ncbi:MAG: hypothetical protein Q9210_004639, partial [Variospora velana]
YTLAVSASWPTKLNIRLVKPRRSTVSDIPVTDVQGQPTRVTSTLDDADVKFRDALEEALKPIDPQPNPTAMDRRKGSQYKEAYDVMYRERNRHKSSQILVKFWNFHWHHSDYIRLIYCQANLLMATFELNWPLRYSLSNVRNVTDLPYRVILEEGYEYRRRHDGYRFTPTKLGELRTLTYGLEKRIEREKDVETVQEDVKREWKKRIKLWLGTDVNRMRESPEMKERFRQMLRREEPTPLVFYLPKVKFVTKTWVVRLTDERLRKTTGCGADDFVKEEEKEKEDEDEEEEEDEEEDGEEVKEEVQEEEYSFGW